MSKPLELTGQKFGRWTVIERVENNRFGQSQWKCVCECGNVRTVNGTLLKRGHSKSCGCYHKEVIPKNLPDNTTHHLSRTPLYRSWSAMIQRCSNPKVNCYKDYGGRGIKVCDEWKKSDTFFEWALENGYEEGKSLDRIDVNGDYCPENCRWATKIQQERNKTTNVHVEVNGKDYVLAELAEELGMTYQTLWLRYKHGDRGERLVRPVNKKHRPKYLDQKRG